MSSLAGRTCVVTGASRGIGLAAARELARLGGHVVLAVRDAARGEQVRRAIVAESGNPRVEIARVDVSLQSSVRAFARELRARHPRLDVLVNNAGVWCSRRRVSAEGIELTWATNVLGLLLTTELLLPQLQAAGEARVVNVASALAGGLDLSDVEFERRRYVGRLAYAQSKQAVRMLSRALARRSGAVTVNAMHPGFVATRIFAAGGGLLGRAVSLYARLRAKSPEAGADTVVYLSASPEVAQRSGGFWIDRRESSCRFGDEAAEEALYAVCRGRIAGG